MCVLYLDKPDVKAKKIGGRVRVERFDGRSPREHIRHEIREFAVYTFGLQKKLGIMSEDDPDGEPEETAESA